MADNEKYYYSIDETAARRAKEANSFREYKAGTATAEYKSMVDKAVEIAAKQKLHTDPLHHDKIDRYLERYCRKLAENMNKSYSIEARVPSIMIAGPSRFPVRAKEKQNSARAKNMEEWRDIQGYLDKIQSVGMGGISADEPDAKKKLEDKLKSLEANQEYMKAVNVYFRKHGTCVGFPDMDEHTARKLDVNVKNGYSWEKQPFPAYALQNNNQNIHATKKRIAQLEKNESLQAGTAWSFEGGEVFFNKENNRVQILYEGKPDEATRTNLKSRGFRWSPKEKAWQRQLNNNGIYAAKQVTGYSGATPKIEKTSPDINR